ncbi:50S ribosomal protein L10 [Candidatus Babeliales bacterium]|nr:50S ribosomal protein L10 [Candidatus Babeliales bacterium]
MNRQQKENVIQDVSQLFVNNAASFVVKCEGLTVAQLHELRLNLANKEGELKVVKNRLVRIALSKNADCTNLSSMMKGQTAVVFAKSDFTGVAKILSDFAKKHESLQIIAGCCESQLFDKQGVVSLGKIPSREVLLSRLCGVLKAPVVKVVGVLSQISEQKSGGAATEQQA